MEFFTKRIIINSNKEKKKQMYQKKKSYMSLITFAMNLLIVFPLSESNNYNNRTISIFQSISFVNETNDNEMDYAFYTIQQPTEKKRVMNSSLSSSHTPRSMLVVDGDEYYNNLTKESTSISSQSTFTTIIPQNISTRIPTSIPTISPTKTTEIIHQSFIQSYCGSSALNFMTPEQISQYTILLQLITSDYAIGQPLVNTKADFLSQNLFITDTDAGACSLTYLDSIAPTFPPIIDNNASKVESEITNELRVKFNMTWSSSIIDISHTEYVENFTVYMNLPETKVTTIHNLNQLGIRAQYASNLRISLNKPTFAPTSQPTTTQPTTTQPTTTQPVTTHPTINPNNNLRSIETILASVFSISIFVIIISIVLFVHKDFFLKIKSYFFNYQSLTDDQRIDLNSEEDINDKMTSNDNNNNSNNVAIPIINYNNPISSNTKNNTISTTATTHAATDNSFYYNRLNRNSVISSPYHNNNNNKSMSTNSSSSFLLKQNFNNMKDELDIYYKNESLEKFRYKLQTYFHFFDDNDKNENEIYYNEDDSTILSHSITNVLLMNDHDCIQILNTIGCYVMNDNVTINEFELEANMLYKSYHWSKINNYNISNNDNYEKKR